ncbi:MULTISPECIES: 3-hydroxyacyl-CoA dehydrogenase NAD-binding domain-containing protein [Pseudoxanthomonas]|uniref:enoyl-CoA hydratase n=1 Tax=Pseudoxanthomonas winnipegensis TaxID=2480810 RepID=A0A4Q8LF14_9GAMM|nr:MULTISPECIES: 3-hydroxyacyl-CoA dehydrogenase NAD-binding domain-containing protein [Pseudoxanthomonas]MDQ1119695.1 3-hydroxyacyl-CoA dehydrogenase/enoyl-CoA hydratase/3-hydroxybutyryl-CoA epimerase [Pseudoxanthomonas winnipegensis]MDQ1132893.1 3-hydroxyacyl-CoA dehydrogenase/enoyl-CoA hydratase/3-hydroxybutyryl-CoA epimerase [Pseudoxanthomonas winnipegensis]MDR6137103.1 3-hydroxyacyl-CoA dehydrogenase/enoyl-CoA hydratase/3-hydroxybutyryl-CoA epimerase [Pseudoxanthomonas sp. SORGH_AS_0997]RZ
MAASFDGLRFSHWRTESRPEGVVVLWLDRQDASVNAFSQDVLIELGDIIERLAIDPPKGVVVASAKASGFIAGADLKEFQEFDRRGTVNDAIRRGQMVFQKLSELPCPTVAAIHGFCMGGGTEISLACRYRVASNDASTRIGLPETKLGIFPGWGGSARLPRLIGAPAAMDLMLTGRTVSASAARGLGLVDKVVDKAVLIDTAVSLALKGTVRPFKQRATAWATNTWPARKLLAPQMAKQVARKARKDQYPAPYALINVWERSGGQGIGARLDAERRAVVKLAGTPTARNLIRIFFLTERLKGLGGKEHGIKHVHVVGAGVMGGDIAAWSAYKGFEVTLQDREQRFIDPAMTRAQALFEKKVKDPAKRPAVAARLKADLAGAGVASADLVIEAIIENPEAKRALYETLEPNLKPDALLTTNTSSIPLVELREHIDKPAQFGGLHYFNPVAMMPLVEIVQHDTIAPETVQRLAAFCKALDKFPVPVAGTPGFLVNRVLFPYMLEAANAYAEGIPGPVIDKAAVKFGMPMGPIELIDTVGLDVAAGVGKELSPFLGLQVPAALATVEPDKRGKKDGQGLYKWENGRAVKPEVPKDYQAPADLEDRLILPLLNEAVACLHDGVVADADLLDAGVIFGTGFAPFRGGPIQHIRAAGADALLERLRALQARHGDRFAPRPGWDNPVLREPVA